MGIEIIEINPFDAGVVTFRIPAMGIEIVRREIIHVCPQAGVNSRNGNRNLSSL